MDDTSIKIIKIIINIKIKYKLNIWIRLNMDDNL